MQVFYEKRNTPISFNRGCEFSYAPHFHPSVEIIFVNEGTIECTIDGCDYEFSEGDAVIVFPNQIHSYRDKTQVSGVLLIIEPSVLPEFKDIFKYSLPESPIILNLALDKLHFASLCDIALAEYEECSSQMQKGWLLVLLGKLFQCCTFTKNKQSRGNITTELLNYCEAHYHESITLKATAKALHISESRLSHIFSEKLKISFNDYINILRVNEAITLLRQTDYTITQISEICGFSTIRTFNRAFAKQTGIPPSKLRQQSK